MSKSIWKQCLSLVVILFIAASLLAGCGSGKTEPVKTEQPAAESAKTEQSVQTKEPTQAEPEGKISMWGWDEESIKKLALEFNKAYPKVTVENILVGAGDYLKKVQTSVAAGMELPDILWAEITFRGKVFALDIWEDLEKEPYNFDRNSVFPYLIPLMSNPEGKVVGIDWTICPAGLAYNVDAAKKYLGTDDPKQIQAMLPDWDTFIQKGKEVTQASGGKAFMLTSVGDLTAVLMGQDPTPIFEGNTINATGVFEKVFDLIVKMRDAGIMDKLDAYTPAWNASYAAGNHIFYPCATWSPYYVIKPNDKEGKGRWRLILPPGGGFSWGGTTMGITKTSKNKEAAWAFIKWSMLSLEGTKANKELINFPSSFKSAYDDAAYASMKDEYFGEQDIGEVFFKEIAPTMQVRTITKDDAPVLDAFNLVVAVLVKDNKLTAEAALNKLKEEIKNKLPDFEIK